MARKRHRIPWYLVPHVQNGFPQALSTIDFVLPHMHRLALGDYPFLFQNNLYPPRVYFACPGPPHSRTTVYTDPGTFTYPRSPKAPAMPSRLSLKTSRSTGWASAINLRSRMQKPRKRRKLLLNNQTNPRKFAQNAVLPFANTSAITAVTIGAAAAENGAASDDEFEGFVNDWVPGGFDEMCRIEREAFKRNLKYCRYSCITSWTFLSVFRRRTGNSLDHRSWPAFAERGLQTVWSNIRVAPSTKASLLQCCLARAGRNPLVLNISLLGAKNNGDDLFAALAPYSMQLEMFECHLQLSCLGRLTDEVRRRTPLLRKLVLFGCGRGTNHTPATVFSEAPQLREVVLDGVSLRLISLPWAQLTHLECRNNVPNPLEIAEMLHRTAHLEKLVLSNIYSSHTAPAYSILLPHLHTLELLRTDVLDIMQSVTLPALKNLVLELEGSDDALLPTVLQLLTRSGCELRSASIAGFPHSFVDRTLAVTPTVTDVRIDAKGAMDDHLIPFFRRLTTDVGFLPNLQTLHMEWQIRAVPAQAVEMLEARWGGGSRKLKSFKLQCHSESWDEVDKLNRNAALKARLHALRADGMEIDMPGI
ncbi:hypothetical protein DFH06DRAFT_1420907 [Mycena polygramma]|nr:hypothetical protein DFH06DRAFT_1420907 [Mycena polygramma]